MTSVQAHEHKATAINVPEAVGVFDTFDDLQRAFYDLRMVGFSRYDISLLARQEVLQDKLGRAYWRAADLEDDPEAPRAAFVSAIAIGGSPGAVVGTLLARRVGKNHKDYYANQIAHGGILLWVRVRDKEREDLAVKILKGHSGRDVHVHPWSE